MIGFLWMTICAALVELSGATSNPGLACVGGRVCGVGESNLRWFLLGDWGGLPVWPYKTYAQTTVAETMGTLALSQITHFQLALGDNFYFLGVSNAKDARFHRTFTDVYGGFKGLSTPWYALAGNHDHYGNVTGEVAYTRLSDRWVFPSLNYTIRYRVGDGSRVDIIMIDTVGLCGNTRDISNAGLWEYFRSESSEPSGPKDEAAAESQWAWIEKELATSKANHLFVAGHFPVWSIAEHGPTTALVNRLRPLLLKYKASAYFSGHDHNLQHLMEGGQDGTTLNFVVSGAGAYLDDSTSHASAVPTGSLHYHYPSEKGAFGRIGLSRGAFVLASANRSAAEFRFLRGDGKELYRFHTAPRPLHV